jgi:hypothetical protein
VTRSSHHNIVVWRQTLAPELPGGRSKPRSAKHSTLLYFIPTDTVKEMNVLAWEKKYYSVLHGGVIGIILTVSCNYAKAQSI